MRPMIGVSGKLTVIDRIDGVYLGAGYTNGVAEAGGIPVVIPYLENEEDVRALAQRLDGLLLSGGVDMGALEMGEEPIQEQGEVCPERDWIEAILFDEMQKQGKPVLGICRGMQMINILMGGKVYQDIKSQKQGELLQHSQRAPHWYGSHSVQIVPDTLTHQIFGEERLAVNTYHHQAVSLPAPGLRTTATAPDGVIEAIERDGDGPFLVGVQWHPELMWRKNRTFLRLFTAFVDACKASVKA